MAKENLTSKIIAEMACCNDLLETLYSLSQFDVEVFLLPGTGQMENRG